MCEQNNFLEKNKTRALTRYKDALSKRKMFKREVSNRLAYQSLPSSFEEQDEWMDNVKKHSAYLYKHPKKCSCCMCGNPRRYAVYGDGLTLKELAFEDKNHPDNVKAIKENY